VKVTEIDLEQEIYEDFAQGKSSCCDAAPATDAEGDEFLPLAE
jgi:hypothetical protein